MSVCYSTHNVKHIRKGKGFSCVRRSNKTESVQTKFLILDFQNFCNNQSFYFEAETAHMNMLVNFFLT